METEKINVRDPYVLLHDGTYYLYGTRSNTCWGKADGFDCYTSTDLKNWEGPIEIFKRREDFFADQNFWAPECYYFEEKFYLVTTFGAEEMKKGIYILQSEAPTGPFELYSDRLTPEDWTCIDGTLYLEEGKNPCLIFSHSFEDMPDGDMCAMEHSKDLRSSVTKPVTIFSAAVTNWAHPVPFAKAEFDMDGDVYFTDGPCAFQAEKGELHIIWSSWGTHGYAVGDAVSESGKIEGPYRQVEKPLFPENGGHGMTFLSKEGKRLYTLHYPNDKLKEHPVFYELVQDNEGKLELRNL